MSSTRTFKVFQIILDSFICFYYPTLSCASWQALPLCHKQDMKCEICRKGISLGTSLLLVWPPFFLIPMAMYVVRVAVVGLSEAFKLAVFPLLLVPGGGQTVVARCGAAQQGWSPDTKDSYFPPDAQDGENTALAITRFLSI